VRIGRVLLISLVIGLLEAGCWPNTNNRNIGDGGFLSAEPCGPPCFFEIVPGVTTKNQAISMLQTWELYMNCQEYDNRKQGGVRGVACQNISIGLQNDLDIVESVGFQPMQTITIEKVIAKHGEPSGVLVIAEGYPQNNEYVASMLLYYDTIRVTLVLAEQNSGEYSLTPTTTIINIGYSDQKSYDLSRKYSQAWKGYTTYEQWNP